MAASRIQLGYWRTLDDRGLSDMLAAARESVAAFADATDACGSLIQSWIRSREVLKFAHYPPEDIVDRRHGSQFYYHAHRDGDLEHGHLHLFWHATAGGRRRRLPAKGPAWSRAAPSHLFAISFDPRGLPVALFTVNRWVTDGYWFDAATTLQWVERFALETTGEHSHSRAWITAFVKFYRPLIRSLLLDRDRRLARRPDPQEALSDHRLEVLSRRRLDWLADLDAIEAEASRRKLRA